jgi:hypothetical protein
VVIPTRAGGVEPNRVVATLEMTPSNIPAGVVICSARLGTNDLEATVAWWTELKVPVWGIIPERVSIAAGPSARLAAEGFELYGQGAQEGDGQGPLSRRAATGLSRVAGSRRCGSRARAPGAFPRSWPMSSARNQRRTAMLAEEAGRSAGGP